MNDLQQYAYLSKIVYRLDKIEQHQRILIEQLSALSRAYAKQNDLALEEEEMECEYLNDFE